MDLLWGHPALTDADLALLRFGTAATTTVFHARAGDVVREESLSRDDEWAAWLNETVRIGGFFFFFSSLLFYFLILK